MSTFDENLFGRIAVHNQYLLPEQLERCLQIQRSEAQPRLLGDVLLEEGALSREQVDEILRVRRKKVRKLQRRPSEVRENDLRFGQLALSSGLVGIGDLEGAILEQQRLQGVGLNFRIGEVLVSTSRLVASQVLEVLRLQGKRLLLCPGCDAHYHVVDLVEGKQYECPQCGTALMEPKFIDTVTVDSVIQGS